MKRLRNVAAALMLALVLSTAAIAGDMQGPGLKPPIPEPSPITGGSTGNGDMGSPGDPGESCVSGLCVTDEASQLSAAEDFILSLIAAIF